MDQTAKTWRLVPHDQAAIENLAQALKISPIVAQLLLNRQQADPQRAQRFLDAPLTGLYEPATLPGVAEAVDRLLDAARQKRRICVYGDYDVDGVAGTAILVTALCRLGADVQFHIPHRVDDGYGLSSPALRRLAESGFAVVVSVDCGITSVAEAEEARRLGLELIITDHHEPKETLPNADVLVHPGLPGIDGPYAFRHLSGAGVAFKLAWALCQRACGGAKVTAPLREFLLDSVALAALGTIADVVPLQDENRIVVRYGLDRLGRSPSVGLQALLQSAGLTGKKNLAAMDVGFSLAPRLNAAGRLGTARLAVELLTTSSAQRAGELASVLEEQNRQRQLMERDILGEARTMADGCNGAAALVLASPNWHPGLIGIVAGRLADLYNRPVLMIAIRADSAAAPGSGRSVSGFQLHEALQECTADLLSHGGHAAAAGFRIAPDALTSFRQRFEEVAARRLGSQPPPASLTIDAEVPLAALTPGLLQAMTALEPYGCGNPQPLFLAGDLQVVGTPRKVGNGERHLAFHVAHQGRELRAIAFGMADRAAELLSAAGRCALVFTPRLNEWNGMRKVELEIRDFQAGERARLQ